MKKFLLALVVLTGAAFSASAQSEGGKFSIGVEAGLPVGDLKTTSSFIIGGSLKYDQPVAESTFVTLSAGYSNIQGKTVGGFKYGNSSAIPVKAGLKYFFSEGFYGEAQAGAAFLSDGAGTAFAYAPGVGYSFGGGVDLGVRYEAWTKSGATLSQIGLRLAYSF
ncbi:hypothetical protein DJ568_02230 [Mucilaginibacter hurinus]|uniref:Outer membrane protein beta-barrel domain-containing protein n=1 Tax=Mucilaginibacter hurinus TaxID=2201324 RepID=A0A367GUF1_9SPHI|nr:outer membrane beta-barrel protein [Mucilaginibacter hurinus]RCH56695.1 hypothetical protein DJ568_02230 [Mucilaginibacter hurinus]